MIAKHHEDRWAKLCLQREPSYINQAKRALDTMKTGQEMGRRPQHLLTNRQIQQRQQRSDERHDVAHYGGRQLGVGCYGKLTS